MHVCACSNKYMSMERKTNKRGDYRGMSEASKKGYANLELGKWKKGQSGNPNGRPKNRVKEFLDSILTVKQVKENTKLEEKEIDEIEQYIICLDTPALKKVVESEKAPTYMRTLARAAIWDMKNGKTQTMNLLRDRQYGAIKQKVDVTTNGESMIPQSMTPDEAKDLLKRIEENC